MVLVETAAADLSRGRDTMRHDVTLITHWLRKVITSLGSTCLDIEVKPVGVTHGGYT